MREQSSQIIEENYRIWLEVEREGTLLNDIEIAEEKWRTRYGAGKLKWNEEDIEKMDRKRQGR